MTYLWFPKQHPSRVLVLLAMICFVLETFADLGESGNLTRLGLALWAGSTLLR